MRRRGKERELRVVSGHVIAVQEQRFRLQAISGEGYLFTLSRNAPVTPDDLQTWLQMENPVVVTYSGEPDLISGIAHQVRPVVGGASRDVPG